MKKLITLLLIAIVSTAVAQDREYAYFLKTSWPTNGSQVADDTAYIKQSDIYFLAPISTGGTQINYLRGGAQRSVNVREQMGDSARTSSRFSFTLTTNASLDSITVAGVKIVDTVPAAASATLTAGRIRDSINADTSSPDYRASASGAVVTIYLITDSTNGNGRAVVVDYNGTATPSNGVLSGGLYRRNLLTLYGPSNKLFSTTISGATKGLNAMYVSEMTGNNPVTLWYSCGPIQNFSVSGDREDLMSTVNALP